MNRVQVTWIGIHRVEITWGVPVRFYYSETLKGHVVMILDVNSTQTVILISSIIRWQEITDVASSGPK
jgi:hypothetical protein